MTRHHAIVGVLAAAILTALMSIVPAGASAQTAVTPWRPPRGAVFNDPTGSRAARHVIATRVKAAIRHTPRGETIRFATYSFDRKDVADLLVRAHRRGVQVQVVVNDNSVSPQERRLQRVLGRNRHRSSFLVFCRGSCRSGNGNLHIKIYSFSRSGAAEGVLISSSANLAYGGAFAQWNDAYTLDGDPRLFAVWVRLFDQLRADRRSRPRRVTYRSPTRSVMFQRELARAVGGGRTEVGAARAGGGDPVVRRLGRIGCHAPRGYGRRGRTVVKIAVFAWYGARGDRIADRVADLARRGCSVTVIGSVLGDSTGRRLQRAGIPVKAADWDFGQRPSSGDEDTIVYGPRCYVHYKFFTVDGRYDGAPLKAVWTGSENWSPVSFATDEVTLQLNGAAVHGRYARQFDRLWRDGDATHRFGVQPSRRPCSRG